MQAHLFPSIPASSSRHKHFFHSYKIITLFPSLYINNTTTNFSKHPHSLHLLTKLLMAYYSLPLFLLLLSLSLSLQIQARESRFFSKTTRLDPSKESAPFAEEEPFKTTNYNYDTQFSEDKRNTNNNNPSMFSNEEFNKYETKIPNYPNFNEKFGMSDTRFMENGKYFYDVNAEKYGRGYEPNGERSYGNYGNGHGYEYNNEVRGYENSRENYEGQEEYVP